MNYSQWIIPNIIVNEKIYLSMCKQRQKNSVKTRMNWVYVCIQAIQRKSEMSESIISLKFFVKHIKGHVGAPSPSLSSFALYIEYWSYNHLLSLTYVALMLWLICTYDMIVYQSMIAWQNCWICSYIYLYISMRYYHAKLDNHSYVWSMHMEIYKL